MFVDCVNSVLYNCTIIVRVLYLQGESSVVGCRYDINIPDVTLCCTLLCYILCFCCAGTFTTGKVLDANEKIAIQCTPALLSGGFTECLHCAKKTGFPFLFLFVPPKKVLHHYFHCTVVL